jgi:phage gpG-like protein
MAEFVGIEVLGGRKVEQRFETIAARAKDPRSAFHRIVDVLERAAEKQFATEGSYSGERWQDLKPQTLERRRRQGITGTRILEATGHLRESLTRPGGDNVRFIYRDELLWGTRDLAGAYLAKYRGRRRPRVALAVTQIERRAIVQEIERELLG